MSSSVTCGFSQSEEVRTVDPGNWPLTVALGEMPGVAFSLFPVQLLRATPCAAVAGRRMVVVPPDA